ncbi:MAG: DUF1997 domain-containing protein [Leptolyngbyaceae bacterium]|nr:DUF1997 domain-containing protein [Leptolyngbyaceae bacterium]
MQFQPTEDDLSAPPLPDLPSTDLPSTDLPSTADLNPSEPDATDESLLGPTQFQTRFIGFMDMNAEINQVADYFQAHQGWFRRCAHPMKAEPIGSTGYALVIGRFGAFGYQVEPKVGLDLLPPEKGIYRIKTIPVPDYTPPGYDVDFQSVMELKECPPEDTPQSETQPLTITRVEWQLDLQVTLQFPKFIHKLPKSLIQNTGDSLLYQIVRQVSRRLTYKVQEDFHTSHNLPLPKTAKR